MNRLTPEKQAQVVAALVEGNSIRATVRMTGTAKNTISKLLIQLGAACSDYMNKNLVNLDCKRVQCDETWSFVAAKAKNVTPEVLERSPHAGDCWTWVGMDADTKLVITWAIGARDRWTAETFIKDLAGRMANRIQLSTDGLRLYLFAVNGAFGNDIDYGIIMKRYASPFNEGTQRYSLPECVGAEKQVRKGNPDEKHISTSYIERQNLTMRMHVRRFTRLTNAFSKKIEGHAASLAIHYMWYNYVRIHQTLRVTPAMAAGVTDRLWAIEDIVALLRQDPSANRLE